MDRQALMDVARDYIESSPLNRIAKEIALSDDLAGVSMFDAPVMAVADALSPGFEALRADHVIGDHVMMPTDWLPGAKSVVSFFLPFTGTIRDGNRADMRYPSDGWLHARIEGQAFINSFSKHLVDQLGGAGYETVAPSIDARFFANMDQDARGIGKRYTSNWSERHAAYVCGLGTFGLSKGLITEKGMAGRFTSIVTALELVPDGKAFARYDENCTRCGKCIANCPANAISFEHGKDHDACSRFVSAVSIEKSPRYGCGKCQVGVPCESRNPRRA